MLRMCTSPELPSVPETFSFVEAFEGEGRWPGAGPAMRMKSFDAVTTSIACDSWLRLAETLDTALQSIHCLIK